MKLHEIVNLKFRRDNMLPFSAKTKESSPQDLSAEQLGWEPQSC